MSCSVMWKPVFNDGKYVGSGSFRDILDRTFGFPAKLRNIDVKFLEGMVACGHEEAQILIDAIYKELEIEIFLEC